MADINATHDPGRRSWVESANRQGADFPIQNLPFGRYRIGAAAPRAGIAIGDAILDLGMAIDLGLFQDEALRAAAAATSSDDLTPLLTLGNGPASALRARVSEMLDASIGAPNQAEAHSNQLLVDMASVSMLLPLSVRQFSDMCVSTFHIGRWRGNDEHGQPICPPVFRSVPVGYDGRASSIVVSGTPVRRPNGTWQAQHDEGGPLYGPEPRQDYELELGIWFGGQGNELGLPIGMHAAGDAIFGYCLLNDWSSRGIQVWEMMLGPFLGKSMATTVSPWIITAEALAPFRTAAFARPVTDPPVPDHLWTDRDQNSGGIDIKLEAFVQSERMANAAVPPFSVCQTNFSYMYWTPAQMLAHHSSNGCSFSAGDLLGSGTCSGPAIEQAACLGEKLLGGGWSLPDGEERHWLEDGDTVILRGQATAPGFVSIGFGEARGTLLPAHVS